MGAVHREVRGVIVGDDIRLRLAYEGYGDNVRIVVENGDEQEVITGVLQGPDMDDLRRFVQEYDAACEVNNRDD